MFRVIPPDLRLYRSIFHGVCYLNMYSVALPAGGGGVHAMNNIITNKMAYSTERSHWSVGESLKNSSSSMITISSECNTQ